MNVLKPPLQLDWSSEMDTRGILCEGTEDYIRQIQDHRQKSRQGASTGVGSQAPFLSLSKLILKID